jgi:hypothetical protein
MGTQEDNNKNEGDKLKGREDKREHNIDSNVSIKEMREGKAAAEGEDNAEGEGNKEDDALNYKNDREHGAFNPKNI